MKKNLFAAAVALAAFGTSNAHAYQVFFGEDLNSNPDTPLSTTPLASQAEADFLVQLTGVGTETFESKTTGEIAPLALLFPGAGTATLSGSNGEVAEVTPGSTNGAGRYSIPSATSAKFWEVSAGTSGDFTITFTQSIAAFGFYGVDIGDFGGQLTLTLSNGDELLVDSTDGSNGSTDGSVLYYGVIADTTAEEFTSISFTTTTGQGDIFAFDNFTIGTREQVCRENCGTTVPEPATLGLLGLGLMGLAAARRRKSA